MTKQAAIDAEALERLREWGGEKLVGQMIRLFLENAPVRMDQIRSGVEESRPEESEHGAHSLKSSAANIGARELRRVATEVERAAGEGDLESLETLLPEIEDVYHAARAELEAIEGGDEA